MNDKKIAILLVSVVLCLGGIFHQAQVNADSYTSGGSASTLQGTVTAGNTATLAASNVMELTATGSYIGLLVDHDGTNTGDNIQITQDGNGGGDGIQVTQANAGGKGINIINSAGIYGLYVAGNIAGSYGVRVESGVGIVGGSFETVSNSYPAIQGLQGGSFALYSGTHSNDQVGTLMALNAQNTNRSAGPLLTYNLGHEGQISTGYGITPDATNMFFASTTVTTSGARIRNTNQDDVGIGLIFERAPFEDVGTADDYIANIQFNGEDATNTLNTYAGIEVYVGTATPTTSIDGIMDLRVVDDDTLRTAISIDGKNKGVFFGATMPPVVPDVATGTVTCTSTIRGAIVYDSGGAGVTDEAYICLKSAADTYAWRVLWP